MKFKLPEGTDSAAALRELEPKLPAQFRDTYLQAINELEERKRFCQEAADELEAAANLRAGQMDSQSRADDVARQVRQTLVSIAARARSLA